MKLYRPWYDWNSRVMTPRWRWLHVFHDITTFLDTSACQPWYDCVLPMILQHIEYYNCVCDMTGSRQLSSTRQFFFLNISFTIHNQRTIATDVCVFSFLCCVCPCTKYRLSQSSLENSIFYLIWCSTPRVCVQNEPRN